jgi:hypothetical protein
MANYAIKVVKELSKFEKKGNVQRHMKPDVLGILCMGR